MLYELILSFLFVFILIVFSSFKTVISNYLNTWKDLAQNKQYVLLMKNNSNLTTQLQE